ncbi:hypothetical protein [Methanobacterium spitsbergense]|uniref:Uncharacterized protein n=1 Tax=Methanobacterium spitsbergense TaxID=2874285 RepID=A0A8T5V0Q0_9EURY|nr:hypothetical protein [Methanobacterium spitsbergense]MBZ2167020.1 hypothetical protein [Methanobacterium spitsbergense]
MSEQDKILIYKFPSGKSVALNPQKDIGDSDKVLLHHTMNGKKEAGQFYPAEVEDTVFMTKTDAINGTGSFCDDSFLDDTKEIKNKLLDNGTRIGTDTVYATLKHTPCQIVEINRDIKIPPATAVGWKLSQTCSGSFLDSYGSLGDCLNHAWQSAFKCQQTEDPEICASVNDPNLCYLNEPNPLGADWICYFGELGSYKISWGDYVQYDDFGLYIQPGRQITGNIYQEGTSASTPFYDEFPLNSDIWYGWVMEDRSNLYMEPLPLEFQGEDKDWFYVSPLPDKYPHCQKWTNNKFKYGNSANIDKGTIFRVDELTHGVGTQPQLDIWLIMDRELAEVHPERYEIQSLQSDSPW